MLNRITTSFKAFFRNPLKFLSNPEVAVIEYQVATMQAEGRSLAEIDQTLNEMGIEKGGLAKVADGVFSMIDYGTRNIGWIIVLALVLVGAYYFFLFRRAVG